MVNPKLKDEELEIPEYMRQRQLVSQGLAKWEDFTFEERTCKGWLSPYLLVIDWLTHKRWNYWHRTLEEGKILDEPIPQINFSTRNTETIKMLEKCLSDYSCYSDGVRLPDFLEWILWGFGLNKEKPKTLTLGVNEYWYRTFNLGLLMKYPHDCLGDMLADTKAGKTYWNNPQAFFPTPHHIVEMMTRVNFSEQSDKTLSVCDPCMGTGRMLLHASNYSLNLYGIDIDYTCVMAAKINAMMYVPWMIKPAPWLKQEPLIRGNSLTMSIEEKPRLELKIIKKTGQLKLF